jgi:glycosyltransferase involved in cell wall biosynthesis
LTKLSILIPTHNRPDLFQRCLHSVLSQLPENIDLEIIVNNDSQDIREIEHDKVSYYYAKFDHLSYVYKFLLEKSEGEYVYFLEDDDYLAKDFFEKVPLVGNHIAGNYMPCHDRENLLEYTMMYLTETDIDAERFIERLDYRRLQLSQHIFKRKTIIDFDFPDDSEITNDIILVIHAVRNAGNVNTLNKVFYHQTQDGGDNISFPESNK